jgi:thiamine-monophosphate kinase
VFPTLVTGGDDYEILATVPRNRCTAFREAAAQVGIPVTEIGHIEAGSGFEISDLDGAPLTLGRLGWDHF